MTFDEKLAIALSETAAERSAQMNVIKKHRFSFSYRLWKYKTLSNLRRNRRSEHWTLKKARLIVVAVTVAISLLIGGTAYAAVVMVGRYGFENKIDYSKMLIETHPSDKTAIEEYYGLPEEDGWELVNYDFSPHSIMANYRRGEKTVAVSQYTIDDGNMGNINTENADIEMVSLYTENDGFVLEYHEDWTGIFWIYDGYMFEIDGNLDKSEAKNLALSTKIGRFPKKF